MSRDKIILRGSVMKYCPKCGGRKIGVPHVLKWGERKRDSYVSATERNERDNAETHLNRDKN